MLDQESQVRVLTDLAEGDVIEAGVPFLFAPTERFAWKCVGIEPETKDRTRYTFHVFYMGVVVKAACGVLNKSTGKVQWRAS